MTELPGAYRPGSTPLHRVPAGAKLALLAAYAVLVVALGGPVSALVLLGVSLTLAAWGRLPLRATARRLRLLLVMLAVVAAYQTWQRGADVAVHVVGDLLALVLAALTLTATTRTEDLLEAILRLLSPLRRLGVRTERVALAFSLMIRTVPQVLEIADETRAAARARGLERSPRALLVPMALRTVAHAIETGEALDARGIAD